MLIDGEGSEHLPVRGEDRRGPRGAQSRVLGGLPAKLPERIGLDIGDRHLPREIHGGGAGAEANADRRSVHGGDELARQARRHAEGEHLALAIEQADGAAAARDDALDHFADRLEHRGQRRVRRDLLEYASLARRDRIAALALGDVGDAGAYQAAMELGRRTKRTSQGMVCPSESQWTHSNTGVSPASAPSM